MAGRFALQVIRAYTWKSARNETIGGISVDGRQTLMSRDSTKASCTYRACPMRGKGKLVGALIMQNQFAFTRARLVLNYVDPSAD